LQIDPGRRIPLLLEATKLYRNYFLTGFSLKDAYSFNEWTYAQGETVKASTSHLKNDFPSLRGERSPTTAQRACGKQSHFRFAGNEFCMRHLRLPASAGVASEAKQHLHRTALDAVQV